MAESAAGRVLVVEDEPDLARLVSDYLQNANFGVEVISDGLKAVGAVQEFSPDVLVLDIGLPGLDGFEVLRQVRTFSDCHVLMLTARDDEVDKIVGLSLGADDYVTKPFSPRELVARVQSMMRRARPLPTATLQPDGGPTVGVHEVGDLVVDEAAREVRLAGAPVMLTKTEFDLLASLAVHPNQVLSRHQLLERVWGGGWTSDEHLVDVHLARVRRKLGEDAANPNYIHTVRGIGYRMGGRP
ncbi:response regulator transcription factor [Citricoccus nitrophenolicus]|uniref:Response regulator transcription factor n=1 Tax=Citricoccus nitrophenolicus TaxID=863575 RepID=A0ABV0IM07_9MICC